MQSKQQVNNIGLIINWHILLPFGCSKLKEKEPMLDESQPVVEHHAATQNQSSQVWCEKNWILSTYEALVNYTNLNNIISKQQCTRDASGSQPMDLFVGKRAHGVERTMAT